MKVGVHDLIDVKPNETTVEAYQRTASFVKEIEAMNYHRYWFAEHHNSPNYASVAPELLVSYMAAITTKMRLGTGGTMIMHYSPLKIAEDFKTLQGLAGGRVDIGLGRAPGSGPNEITALAQGRPNAFDDQYDKIGVILDYLSDETAPSFYGKTKAAPLDIETLPEPWMLGSSGQSALKAAELGLGYSFAKFFGLETDPEVFELYRHHFEKSAFFDQPNVMVSYMMVIAETEEEAAFLAKPILMKQIAMKRGIILENKDPELVKDYQFTPHEEKTIQHYKEKRFVLIGSKDQVGELLREEQELLTIDEVLAYSPIYDDEKRLASYRYLKEIVEAL
ncbi:MsnO8 family LLM class oxidoreductase [Aerococcaceae bacterium DSM 111020]|nr:MsnO8 family LLM class oxidoreductase [Aerococcaceae bacterium DSM 111020]